MKLGWEPKRIPRNVKSCVNCGHCNNGCSYNSKQSTICALLEPLANHSDTHHLLHIIPHCTVQHILMGRDASGESQAVGVEGVVHQYADAALKGVLPMKPIATQ